MKLYSNSTDPFSHRCRIVLFEKGMDFEVINKEMERKGWIDYETTSEIKIIIEFGR